VFRYLNQGVACALRYATPPKGLRYATRCVPRRVAREGGSVRVRAREKPATIAFMHARDAGDVKLTDTPQTEERLRIRAIDVGCSDCGAHPGDPCVNRGERGLKFARREIKSLHDGRYFEAQMVRNDRG